MEKLLKQLIGRMDTLIKINLITGFRDFTVADKVMLLHGAGISQAEIANLLGVGLGTVTKTVSRRLKKSQKAIPKRRTEADPNAG